ncbi:MAG: hypothetical protein AB8H80_10355 [Planctomycetota bacterium]
MGKPSADSSTTAAIASAGAGAGAGSPAAISAGISAGDSKRPTGRCSRRLGFLLAVSAATAAATSDTAQAQRLAARGFTEGRIVMAGEQALGKGLHYPSPVFRDIDEDGLTDIVVGDLVGNVYVAYGRKGAPQKDPRNDGLSLLYGPPERLKLGDGKPLRFNNW